MSSGRKKLGPHYSESFKLEFISAARGVGRIAAMPNRKVFIPRMSADQGLEPALAGDL